MSEYLLIWDHGIHSLWTEAARRCGKMLCSTRHDGDCSWVNGCGIGDENAQCNVIPITSVDGIRSEPSDVLLLVTPKKKNANVDAALVESSIGCVLRILQQRGVVVFVSQGASRQRRWVGLPSKS
jgi:hypothetical protein